jgi:hypothetical protein
MTIQRYRRKPEKPSGLDILTAAMYLPSKPLDDLRTVAEMALDGEVAVCVLPSGPVLVAAFTEVPDEHASYTDYTVIQPGGWLAYSARYGNLSETDGADLAQFYDPVPEGYSWADVI